MRNMSKILDWDDEQFGKEVFLSLEGKAAERINDMSSEDMCKARQNILAKELPKSCLGGIPFHKI